MDRVYDSSLYGIGETRLNQIMEAVQKHFGTSDEDNPESK